VGKPTISDDDFKQIFSNIEAILAYNTKFYEKLENRISVWTMDKKIADLFLTEMKPMIVIYTVYTTSYDNALTVLETAKAKYTAFKNILKEVCEKEFQGQDVSSILITPIQRMTRYMLLLKEVIKFTRPDHPDLKDLNKAFQEVSDAITKVNETKRNIDREKKRQEDVSRLRKKIECKHEDINWAVSRDLLRECTILIYDPDTEKQVERNLYLFTDMALLTRSKKSSKSKEALTNVILLDNAKTENMADGSDFLDQNVKNAFMIHTPIVSYLFFATSQEEKKQLYADFIQIIADYKIKKQQTSSIGF